MKFNFSLLWALSKVKSKLIILFLEPFNNDILKEHDGYLKYPANIPAIKSIYSKIFFKNHDVDINFISIKDLKKVSKSLSYNDLISLHNYFNTLRNFKFARIIFYEIIRRASNFTQFFRVDGTKQFIALSLLVNVLIKKKQSKLKLNLKLYFLNYLCNRYISNSRVKRQLKGKKIAMIGGAPEHKKGQQIDSFEYVIRLNQYPSMNSKSLEDTGIKTDMICFRNERTGHLLKENFDTSEYKKFLCSIKNIKHFKLLNLQNKYLAYESDGAFKFGLLNGIQNNFLDLLRFDIDLIHVFGVDFNSSKGYQSDYRPKKLKPVNFDLIFGSHPPHVQYLLSKFFFENYEIEFSDVGKNLLKMSNRHFFRNFQSQYNIIE